MLVRSLLGVAILAGLLFRGAASAQDPPAAPPPEAILPPVTVTAPPPLASSSEQIIPGRDFELRPQGRPADVLRLIPGLIINQHQGGGKAEQHLIRGFDADHGTDLAIFVDGVPVNLRSHAHGQGYADLHFLVPETVRAVDVLKGPYFPATYWVLDLASELVFVGDDGTTEARGRSRRQGIEVGTKVKLLDWLAFTGDFTYTSKAEFVDTRLPIPLAPIWTARADLTARLPFGLSSSLEMRHVGDRIADDFGHQTARGDTLFNSTTRYRYKNFEAFFTVENLTSTEWREAQFFFTSRLRGEPAAGVDDIHFTPGTPRSFFGGVAYHF
jgi:outer membrane receptor for ferrienterochelin and colicin